MTDTEYNGWTNFATWRVALEMFNALAEDQVKEWWTQCAENSSNGVPSIYLFSRFIKEMTVEAIFEAVEPLKPPKTYRDITMPEIVAGWAAAFVNNVNFDEIAEHLHADYIAPIETGQS